MRAGGQKAGPHCSTHGMEWGRGGRPEPLPPQELPCPSPGMVGLWNVPSDLAHGLGKTNVVVKARLRAPA